MKPLKIATNNAIMHLFIVIAIEIVYIDVLGSTEIYDAIILVRALFPDSSPRRGGRGNDGAEESRNTWIVGGIIL